MLVSGPPRFRLWPRSIPLHLPASISGRAGIHVGDALTRRDPAGYPVRILGRDARHDCRAVAQRATRRRRRDSGPRPELARRDIRRAEDLYRRPVAKRFRIHRPRPPVLRGVVRQVAAERQRRLAGAFVVAPLPVKEVNAWLEDTWNS